MGTPKQSPEILPGTLDLLILRALLPGRMRIGYGIASRLQQVSDDVLRIGESSLYPALQRLLLHGWVKAEWGISEQPPRALLHVDSRWSEATGGGARGVWPDGGSHPESAEHGMRHGLSSRMGYLLRRLQYWWRREQFESELAEEIKFHAEQKRVANLEAGLDTRNCGGVEPAANGEHDGRGGGMPGGMEFYDLGAACPGPAPLVPDVRQNLGVYRDLYLIHRAGNRRQCGHVQPGGRVAAPAIALCRARSGW